MLPRLLSTIAASRPRGEIPVRRAVDDAPVPVVARAVTGAVPTLLRRVPGDGTAGVCADRLALMQHPVPVSVGGDLREAAPDDAALVRFDLRGRIHLAARQPVGVVRDDVEVLVNEIRV